jgi:hypothetical protein
MLIIYSIADVKLETPPPPEPVAQETEGEKEEEQQQQEPPPKLIMNEERRLASVISKINHDAQIIPRGGFYRDNLKKIHLNPMFKGIIY